ncbi:MAG TPA: peptidase M64 N-terminal domain-containing protein, partial [Candidatus Acidoferrum sp.]|nr:peptidase M64 N-terminal domain-containing protein [Candidatus Acidoferrum sp.]
MSEKPLGLIGVLFFLAAATASAAPVRTMRLDYYHTGDATQEHFGLDRVVLEPLPWPGNPRR